MNNFHKIENINPCNPFAKILVFNPRPNNPLNPSLSIIASAASTYPTLLSFTCLYVFTTLSEFETVSETTEAENPMNAWRRSFWPRLCAGGRVSWR